MRLCNWFWSMNHEWKCCVSLAAAAAKSLQSCPTLCDPIYGSPPGSPVPGILQARILEWVAISFSNAWNWKVKMKSFSRIWLLATPWTAAHQAPPSMGFSRQEYWSGVPLPSPYKYIHTQYRSTLIYKANVNTKGETDSNTTMEDFNIPLTSTADRPDRKSGRKHRL